LKISFTFAFLLSIKFSAAFSALDVTYSRVLFSAVLLIVLADFSAYFIT